MRKISTLSFLFVCALTVSAHGTDPKQPVTNALAWLIESPDFYISPDEIEPANTLPPYIRKHKKLPESYSGYTIELIESDGLLPLDYPLFLQFGSVYFTEVDHGRYSYCLMVNFNSKRNLKAFITNIIEPRAGYARMVKIKKGKRVKSYGSKSRS